MIAALLLSLLLQAAPPAPVNASAPPLPPPASPVPFKMPPIVLTEPGAGGVRVEADGVFGNFYPAVGKARAPGVLLLGGSEGGLGPGAVRSAQALSQSGFAVLQLAYFGAPGTPPALVHVPLETFDRGLAWLAAQPQVQGRRLAVVGASKGAEAALLVAAAHPELKAAVVAAPSAVVWPGIDFSSREMASSWTRAGAELPFLRYGTPPAGTPGIAYIFTGYRLGFETLAQHPDAAIPAAGIRAPVMLVCGEADTLWPSCPMSRRVQEGRLAAHREVQLLTYPEAGHGLFGSPVDRAAPGYASLGAVGGTPDANNAARQDAWPRMLAFLHAKLDR